MHTHIHTHKYTVYTHTHTHYYRDISYLERYKLRTGKPGRLKWRGRPGTVGGKLARGARGNPGRYGGIASGGR